MESNIKDLLKKRILILDGAMGTSIQKFKLTEEDYRGKLKCNVNQKGNNDILNITNPEIIKNIHSEYLKAGADIIETNTFNSNSISQGDYEMQSKIQEINLNGARIARKIADAFT
ncbi:MAG: homocysteine S-methyltransferase family protein, partial [Clostridium sp.]|nr:homocysteine S-methyltransferase family protein [Clostridium sp.]